jgi:hypothetical protein
MELLVTTCFLIGILGASPIPTRNITLPDSEHHFSYSEHHFFGGLFLYLWEVAKSLCCYELRRHIYPEHHHFFSHPLRVCSILLQVSYHQ